MFKKFFVLLLCTLFLLALSEGTAAGGCKQHGDICDFIETMRYRVSAITTESCGGDCTSLEDYVSEILDLVSISKFVMGKHWTTANSNQRQRFLDAYGAYIRNAYAAQLRAYAVYHMRIMNTKQIADGRYLTKMRLSDPDNSEDFFILEFHIIDGRQGLRIVDVKINNTISLAGSERSTVDSAIKTHGLDNIIQKFEARRHSTRG